MSPATNADPEKASYTSSSPSPPSVESSLQKQVDAKPTMSRKQLFILLVVALLTVTYVSGSKGYGCARRSISAEEKQRFQDLLGSVDPVSLHNVLKENEDKYQHGVFQEDKSAMEAMHSENAQVATSLIELAKRQATNVTLTTTAIETSTQEITTTLPPATTDTGTLSQAAEPSSAPPPATTSQNPVEPTNVPTSEAPPASNTSPTVNAPTTNPASPAATPGTTPGTTSANTPSPQPSSTSIAPEPSTSAGQSANGASSTPSSPTSLSTTRPSTDSPSSLAPSTSVPGSLTSSSLTNEQSSTRTQTSSNVATVKSSSTLGTKTSKADKSSSAHSVTQQTIYTTTNANGEVSTVTSITVVAGQVDATEGAAASKTSAAKGSLQTNGVMSSKYVGLPGLLGTLGMMVAGAL